MQIIRSNAINFQSNSKNLQIPWKFLCDQSTTIRNVFAAIDQRRNCRRKSAFELAFELSSIDLFHQLLILFHLFLPRDSRSLLSLLSISQLLFDGFAKRLSSKVRTDKKRDWNKTNFFLSRERDFFSFVSSFFKGRGCAGHSFAISMRRMIYRTSLRLQRPDIPSLSLTIMKTQRDHSLT